MDACSTTACWSDVQLLADGMSAGHGSLRRPPQKAPRLERRYGGGQTHRFSSEPTGPEGHLRRCATPAGRIQFKCTTPPHSTPSATAAQMLHDGALDLGFGLVAAGHG
jgi:hypothetical protein